MPEIKLLTDEVIGKIAAGEVVERPSAAIKEMVENSLDAGATAISVEIRDGGISYFRVTDNGSGIRQREIRMAFERHATSKISTSSDLNAIATLGFRGEALASIAAVAKVTCTTRTAEDETGIRVVNEGGRITSIEEAACPQGTSFVVKELFYNTPVRLKFLKKPATEAGLVSDLMMRMILSRPDVSFRYISQGKTLYHSAGDGRMESAVFSIYGSEMTRTMRQVDGCQGGVVLKGYVGIGEAGRSNRGHESFFINGRYMRSGLLSAALEAGCRERVMIGKYPVCVLHLTMPYDAVDVNVHPNKLEVRFQNDAAVAAAVEQIVRDALQDRDAIARPAQLRLTKEETTAPVRPVVTAAAPAVQSVPGKVTVTAARVTTVPVQVQKNESPAAAPQRAKSAAAIQERQVMPAAPVPEHRPVLQEKSSLAERYLQKELPAASGIIMPGEKTEEKTRIEARTETQKETGKDAGKAEPVKTEPVKTEQPSFLPEVPKPLKIIGTLFNTYILVEYEEHLLMIDQHAVHERLRFDRLMKAWDQQESGQELLCPMILRVTAREQMLLEEHRPMLERLGLTVEPFGENEVSVRSIPMILGQPQAEDFVRDILDQLQSERGTITMEKRRAAILQIACKKAVKGGDVLSDEEIRDLVSRMVDQKVTPTCPHGRPLVVAVSRQELEKYFRRIQA